MGYDFNIKPVGAPVVTAFIRPEPEASRTAVATDLPPDKSVTALADSSASTKAASYQSKLASDQVARTVIVDREAAQVVFLTIDKTTNLVVNQYPEESKLRARAYLRALDNAKLDNKALATDRSV
jgi:Glu-tRNA(Gln) amidotransferase subunit E-like FAD-binding protein